MEKDCFAWPHLELSKSVSIGLTKDSDTKGISASLTVAQQEVNPNLTDNELNAALRSFKLGNRAVSNCLVCIGMRLYQAALRAS